MSKPTVYPRECGATGCRVPPGHKLVGLSPRVRGNPKAAASVVVPFGSIPASAGQPVPISETYRLTPVYPRECGATHRCRYWRHLHRRSIPASAGQPSPPRSPPAYSPVYPRECGATESNCYRPYPGVGLSPRVRGNLLDLFLEPGHHRSIPASAGQPKTWTRRFPSISVYPRECGATRMRWETPSALTGLSPRVRGNLTW